MKRNRIVVFIIAVLVLLCMFSACSGSSTGENAKEETTSEGSNSKSESAKTLKEADIIGTWESARNYITFNKDGIAEDGYFYYYWKLDGNKIVTNTTGEAVDGHTVKDPQILNGDVGSEFVFVFDNPNYFAIQGSKASDEYKFYKK